MPTPSPGLDLSWLLLALALVVLLAVLLYNLRERRRLAKTHPHSAAHIEPSLADPTEEEGAELEQPVFQAPFTLVLSLMEGSDLALPPGFAQHARTLVRVGNKAAAVRLVRSESGALLAVEVGLVLANRLGPLTLPDYEAWVERVEALEQRLGKSPARALPSFAELHAQSREAERRLNALDGQMVLHLLATPPTDARLSAWALDRGLEQRARRHYSRMAGHAVAYTFSPADQGRALSCVMDLPRTPDPAQAYAAMVQDLIDASECFEGPIVDESNRVLIEDDLALIEGQLEQRVADLREAGIEPGGWLARAVYV